MKFLLDENQSPAMAAPLGAAAYDAVHVRDLGLAGAIDEEIVEYAGRVFLVLRRLR